jgi:hypothetical protein
VPREAQSRAQTRYSYEQRQAGGQPARAQQSVEPPSPTPAEAAQQAELAIEEIPAADQAKDGQAAVEMAPSGSSRVLLLLRAVPSEAADR